MIDQKFLRSRQSIMPGRETVTLRTTEAADLLVPGARKRPLSFKEVAFISGLGFTNIVCNWILSSLNLSGHVPVVGDVVIDSSGAKFFVQSVVSALMESEYNLYVSKV